MMEVKEVLSFDKEYHPDETWKKGRDMEHKIK